MVAIVKKYMKLLIGVAAVILFAVAFFIMNRSSDLETGNLKHWKSASLARRGAAAQILTGTDEHTDLMVRCLDKVASLPDSADMPVKDAASLCFTGIQMKDSI
ncbi:MAG: hypothetical protein LBJ73_03945 [Rickettsiales bacterium]|jgi:hypothetical protein|nr:hypothetical protein [Rickettsiales bacterium]